MAGLRASLTRRSERLAAALNTMRGVTCTAIQAPPPPAAAVAAWGAGGQGRGGEGRGGERRERREMTQPLTARPRLIQLLLLITY